MSDLSFEDILGDHPVILFYDGVCNVCNFSVQFILRHERASTITFCALQSKFADWLSAKHGVDNGSLDSLMFYSEGKLSHKSEALLRTIPYLSWYFSILKLFAIFPSSVLNFFYDIVARNRYRLFGKTTSCVVPTPEIRMRFIGF